ncbi:MAG: hypothetical protein P4L59_07000 [Desulfosporosinus sp.]|nr:hypothetical protein [Desulfosporosinus sp.]
MNNTVTVWSSKNGANLPANIADINGLTSYANLLSNKEINKIVGAFSSGLYDMAAEYTWARTINILREKVLSFGSEFVLEMLGRSETLNSDSSDFLSEVEIIDLAADLGLLNKTAKMFFLHTSEMIKHFTSRKVEEEMDALDAQGCIKNCVKYVLAMNEEDYEFSFTNFRDKLKSKVLKENDDMIRSLLISPYFYKRTSVRTLINLSKKCESAEQENVFANMVLIVPSIWDDLLADDRRPVGFAYAEAVNDGDKPLVGALKSVLLKVKGFDYVPESLRSNSFIDVAISLLNVHYEYDNFHNEPKAAKLLLSLGTSIPAPALGACITASLVCKLGNSYNVSRAAQPYLDEILENLTPDRWQYYINEVFPGDEHILYKLCYTDRVFDEWFNLTTLYNLENLNIKNVLVDRLIKASINRNKIRVKEIATELYNKIR